MVVPRPQQYRRRMRHHGGYTLVELALVLLLATMLLVAATPSLLNARDVVAVRAARAELIAAAATARSAAVLNGGAMLLIDVASARVWIETDGGILIGEIRDLRSRHGVSCEADRAVPIRVRYDALGIGRLANTTVRLRRGTVLAVITVSAYGRVRS
jgi:type II secretory pathway pseudopilin PulG